jgi:tRNA/tmRNA/rRNA uracil-C5-methylase (TrmA/RlmC/RlmD family)
MSKANESPIAAQQPFNKQTAISCVHFGPCGGCILDNPHFPPIWDTVQEFFAVHEAPLTELQIGSITGWRTKAKLAVRGESGPMIGLFRSGTHEVLEIPHCKIHHPSINQAVAIVEQAVIELTISIYDEKSKTGLLRYIQCFVDIETAKVQLVLIVQAKEESIDHLVQYLEKNPLFHSIWLNIQSQATNTILGESWLLVYGPPFLEQKLAGEKFFFHPGAFSQAHWTLFEKLALDVVSMVPEQAKLLEIYAGIGAMGILASSKCISVALLENNPFAYLSFQALNKSAISYHLGDAKEALPLIPNADCYLLDPPRKGVDPLLLNALLWATGTIIYVSCDFNSFVRDLEDLIEAGWELKEGKSYLLFPGTNHVETVAKLVKAL